MKNGTKKILILRLGAIGDVVHTTIIPSAIKSAHPDWEIHYLTQSENIPLLENNRYIDKIIEWDRSKRKSFKYLISTGVKLFREHYDIIFNLTNAIRNIFLSVFACPKKIVLRKHTDKSWVEDYFYTAQSVIKDITLPVRLELEVNKELDSQITQTLSAYPTPHIIIIPGGKTDSHRQGRTWNLENWIELSKRLTEKYGGTVFVCGGKGELKHHKPLEETAVLLTGEYNLAGSSALLSHADLVISGDTGPLHIASAHNVKTLALLGSTSPDKIKPYGENGYYISADTDCKYCWKKKCKYTQKGSTPCMDKISVDMVLDKITKENLL